MKMKTLGRLLSVGVLLAAATAHAQSVQFYTVGTFSASGGASAMFGTRDPLTLTFVGAGSAANPTAVTVDALGPTLASFGQFITTGGGVRANDLLGNFTLNVFQVGAGAGTGTLIGSLNGSLTRSGGIATLALGAGSVTIGNVTYGLPATTLALVPRSVNGGIVALRGEITRALPVSIASVPEPATLALVGPGLALVGTAVRRRRR